MCGGGEIQHVNIFFSSASFPYLLPGCQPSQGRMIMRGLIGDGNEKRCSFSLNLPVFSASSSLSPEPAYLSPPESKPPIFCKSWGRHLGVLPLFLKICSKSSCFEYHFVSPLPELSWDSEMLAKVSAFPSLLRQFPVASVSRILLTPLIRCHLPSCSFCPYGCMHFKLLYCHFGEGLGQKQKSVGMFNLPCLTASPDFVKTFIVLYLSGLLHSV